MKKNIRNFDLEEIKEMVVGLGQPSFRAEQIFQWLYKKGVDDFFQMTDIPQDMRNYLSKNFSVDFLKLVEKFVSQDGTKKFLFRLSDGNYIESVMIPEEERITVCVSTQVGCKFGCVFCASGKIGFIRNLDVSEILGQILFIKFKENVRISNIVFMGMGEPFDNYDSVLKAIKIINEKNGLNIGARKITVSTAGIVPCIKKFSDFGKQVRLSISLHAPDDRTRSLLMPINNKYSVSELLNACKYYISHTGRRITFEYILIEDVNDTEKHLFQLIKIVKGLDADINVIPFSPVEGINFRCPDMEKISWFVAELKRHSIRATVRYSRGKDIKAACGQLAGRRFDVEKKNR